MKNLTTKQGFQFYEVGSQPQNGGQWVVHGPDFEETRQLFGKSFAGTSSVPGEPVFDWAVNHIPEWYTLGEHKRVSTFGMSFPLYLAMKKNALVVSERLDSEIVSAAVILEYDRSKTEKLANKFVEAWRVFKVFCKLMQQDRRLPKLFVNRKFKKDSRHSLEKGKVVAASFEKWHKEEGPEELHWYIQMVGVAPEQNGKGLGRELMEKVNELADQVGVSCYLECGASKTGFYEKMGYRVLSERLIDDPVDCKREPLEAYIMLRKPLSTNTSAE